MCSSVHVMQKIDSFRAVNFQTDARHFSVKTVEKQQHKSITDVRRLVLVKKLVKSIEFISFSQQN